jgi:hypothetical protein
MSEPKKETVRIVLPPRRDGQPLASNPRETAMINLPPKPMQKPGTPESVSESPSAGEPPAFPKPPGLPSFAPKPPPVSGLSAPPAAPKPPPIAGVAPAAPKPPPVAPVVPKPPSVVGVSPGVPKSGAPPLAPKPPEVPSAPKAPDVPPIASAESKKETAKVPPSASSLRSGLPQASVHLQKRAGSSASSSAITVAPQVQAEGGVSLVVGILALAASLVAVGIQVWMFL